MPDVILIRSESVIQLRRANLNFEYLKAGYALLVGPLTLALHHTLTTVGLWALPISLV